MAWSESMLEASFRGIVFDCLVTDDSFDKALAEHSFPFVPGAEIEDMGRGPRRVSVQGFFYGDDYETALKEFIKALETPGAGEFVHPVFGSWKDAQVARGSIHHEADAIDQAQVSFELVESNAGNPFFAEQTAGQQADWVIIRGQTVRDTSALTLSGMVDTLKALNPLSQLTALRQELLAPIFELKAVAGGIVTAGLDAINYPLSWAGDLTSLAGGVMNVGNFSVGTLLADYRNAYTRLTNTLATGSTAVVIGSRPTEAGAIQAAQTHVQIERATSLSDAAAAVLASEAQTATLTPVDVETVTNLARTELEAAIVQVRAVYPVETGKPIIESLKDTALALQQTAEAVIVARPPLLTRTVVAPVPLRLQAHLWYGDHTRADELQRLNNLRDPNFLMSHQDLLAYAR